MDFHEHGRLEQILNQFLLKSLHVILNSRVPALGPTNRGTGPIRTSDRWFNLALGERPAAVYSSSLWNRNLMEPMVIDIILVPESQGYHSSELASRVNETVLERWVVRYENQRSTAPQIIDASYKTAYKKSIVLLRSIHTTLRLLPAYKAFRKLRSRKQNCDFDIIYKVCSFSKPFSRIEEELMEKYSFLPLEVQRGQLSVSLSYRRDVSEFNLDSIISYPPEIIGDYVGSPLTEPMREFPSSLSERGRRSTSQSNSSFQRPHSWTSGLHKELSSQQNQRYSGSPPLHKLRYKHSVSAHRNQTPRSPAYRKDDLLSPPFSSSPSPTPPTTNYLHSRLHSETAPMIIPHQRFQSRNLSDPNRYSLSPLSSRNTRYGHSSRESSYGSRSMRRQDSLVSGELSPSPVNNRQKMSKEDSGRFSSLLSSSSSPHAGFSWSSSRLSFQDDLGDSDFFGPFIVDDVDPPENQITSVNPGALVHMLRTAPPLRQDTNCYTSKTEFSIESGVAPMFVRPRKTSDALEELKAYKELKDILIPKSTAPTVVKENVES